MVEPEDIDLINPDLLPPQVRQLVRIMGMVDTLNLLAKRGGIPTYVPAQVDNTSILLDIISHDGFVALVKHYHGSFIDLPKIDKTLAQLRDHYICNASKSGRQLAREHGLTYRMIKYIKARQRDEDPNGDLFPLDNTNQDRQATK